MDLGFSGNAGDRERCEDVNMVFPEKNALKMRRRTGSWLCDCSVGKSDMKGCDAAQELS